MSKPIISTIIAKHGLKPGDAMRTLDGDVIDRSRVIGDHMVVYPDGEGYLMVSENVILDTQHQQFLSAAMMEQLRAYAG